MQKTKISLALILSLVFSLSCILPVFAGGNEAALLSVYSDYMLFRQKTDAVIEGTAEAGSVISAVLKNEAGEIIRTCNSTADENGSFTVSFLSPEGSYEEYSLSFFCNQKEFRTLNNIVFGELWLASGQSNMQYPLAQALSAQQDAANNTKLSYWLRVLLVPAYPEYKGSSSLLPLEPQNDITDAQWINGENPAVYSMSAVAYFFAEELLEELDMPIGILNSSLGGSSIRSWLSREAIDSNPEVKNYLCEKGEYIEKSNWNESNQNVYYDMTANFNQKIAPLKNFRPSGMIWYQGETDLITGTSAYDKEFDLLQSSYTEVFDYENTELPVIYTQLASFYYSDDGLAISQWNIDYTEMQKAHRDSRAVITIYDVPLTYLPEAGLIHPQHKEEVGDRMAYCAMGMVYGKSDVFTAATPCDVEIRDGSIYVTFTDAGDSLICPDKVLKGFSICGENGIFVAADAEIVSEDTVRIYSEEVPSPVAVTYAYGVSNQDANLYAGCDNEPALPVSPFITDTPERVHHWFSKPWTYCDEEKIWYTEDDSFSGYYDSWTAENAETAFTSDAAFSGENGLEISSYKKSFSVKPTLTYKDSVKNISFRDAHTDYSDYAKMSFYVKNTSDSEITLEGVRFSKNALMWYAPEINNSLDCETIIPADNEWHKITLDLNRLYHLGNECGLSYSNNKLKNISNIEFFFTSENSNVTLAVDSISFAPETEETGTRYDVDINNADNIIELFTAIILTLVGKFALLFGV